MISETHHPLPDREAIEGVWAALGAIGSNLAYVQILNTEEFNRAYTRFSLYKQILPDLHDPMLNGSISSIIRNLQFQDIIRQKISHVQETNRTLYMALQHFLQGNSSGDTVMKHLAQLNDISMVQAAQLSFAGRQFQVSIADMVTQLRTLHAVSLEFNENPEKLPAPLTIADFKVDSFLAELNSAIKAYSAFEGIFAASGRIILSRARLENLNQLKQLYTMDSEHVIHKNVAGDEVSVENESCMFQQPVESKEEGDLELF